MTITKATLGLITQGTIFTCATADRYQNCDVYGVAITARCDVANDKFPVLNYVPIVSLDDWMHCDGWELIYSRLAKEKAGSFVGLLKEQKINPSVLNSASRKEIVLAYFQGEQAEKSAKKHEDRAIQLADETDRIETLNASDATDRNWLLKLSPKVVATITRELIEHKLTGFYFIPAVSGDLEEGYVALMREVSFLPRELAQKIAQGVTKAEAAGLGGRYGQFLRFETTDFSMPVGQLGSPNIEHLLQSFSLMFGRIGVTDPDPALIDKLCSRDFTSLGNRP